MALELVWSIPTHEPLVGMTTDLASGEIWIRASAHATRLDRHGHEVSTVTIPRAPSPDPWPHATDFTLARTHGSGAPSMIVSGLERIGAEGMLYNRLACYSREGVPQWEHERDRAAREWRGQRAVADQVRDISVLDLDGDGREEVVVSYTYAGTDGVQAINPDGSVRWTFPGNSSETITGGATGPNGEIEVIAPFRGLRVLDAEGKLIRTIDPDLRAGGGQRKVTLSEVRVARTEPGARPVVVASDDKLSMACLDTSGRVFWFRPTDDERWGHIMDARAAPDRPWIALETWRCRRLLVYDVRTGERLATVRTPGWDRSAWCPRIGWLPESGEEPPLLVVGNTWSVTAYTLKPANP